jgi:hypothetical protein
MKQREAEENRGNNEKKWRERERGKDVFYSYLTSPLQQTTMIITLFNVSMLVLLVTISFFFFCYQFSFTILVFIFFKNQLG